MLLARRYRTLEFEELKPFLCDGLIIYAVRIANYKEPDLNGRTTGSRTRNEGFD